MTSKWKGIKKDEINVGMPFYTPRTEKGKLRSWPIHLLLSLYRIIYDVKYICSFIFAPFGYDSAAIVSEVHAAFFTVEVDRSGECSCKSIGEKM
jgi:hypothetical protein